MAVMITVLLGLTLMLEGALSQTRPVIPNTFSFTADVEEGSGVVSVASNFENKQLMQSIHMTTCRAGGTSLVRYDTGHVYTEFQLGFISGCFPASAPRNAPPLRYWDWLKIAIYKGQTNFNGITLDTWAVTTTVSNVSVGVSTKNTNVPVILKQQFDAFGLNYDFTLHITGFSASAPPSPVFNVPSTCGGQLPSVGQQFMIGHPSLIMPPFIMDPTGEVFKKMTVLDKH